MLALDGGRMLPGKISFGNRQHDLTAKTMFDREAQGGVFSAPNPFKWAILSLQGDQENVQAQKTFLGEFKTACQRSNLNVSEPVVQELPKNAQAFAVSTSGTATEKASWVSPHRSTRTSASTLAMSRLMT